MQYLSLFRRAPAAAAVVAVLLTGCTGHSAPRRAASPTPSRRPNAPAPAPEVRFSVGAAELRGTGDPATLPAEVQAAVLSTLDRYLTEAVVGPLRTGAPPPDLAPLFTELAGPRLATADRAAIVDEGLPAAPVAAEAAVANLTGLAGPDGGVALVGVTIDLRLHAGQLSVVREGELVLVPEGDAWKIDGYDLRVSRDAGTPATTTTAAASKT